MSDYLIHYGVKGMKWGVRKDRYHKGERMRTNTSDSRITQRVKNDYNNLSEDEFRAKYQVSKNRYRKRVNRYGDPYMNSPLAKAGKRAADKTKKPIPKSEEKRKEPWMAKESRIENRARKREESGHKYLARKKEYREKKKLYDKYGVNPDFESRHTRELVYKNGEASFKSTMVVYKDVVVKDKGGTAEFKLPNGKVQKWKFSDSDYTADRIAEVYGDTAVDDFYNSYKHK